MPQPGRRAGERRAFPFWRAALVPLFVLLVSCGGGDNGGAAPAPAETNAPGGGSSTTPVDASYAAGSPQAAAFQRLNSARAQCGFGTLAQARELDASASAHANYMSVNNTFSHTEVRGQPGFTGVSVGERAAAAGYRFSVVGEALAQVSSGSGADAVRELMAAPYHAILLLESLREVGLGWSTVAGLPALTVNVGTRQGQSAPQPSTVLTYPCHGIADAVPVGGNESPSPFPSEPSRRWGQPVMVRGPADLALASAAITGPAGSVQVQAIYGEGQTADPNATGSFTRGSFTIIPAPLQPGTTYTVRIDYTAGGSTGRREFTFTTAGR